MRTDVCIVGAGIVGIAAALELQSRGADVLLIDRAEPGKQTSYGNAGVLSASTVLNVNNPNLFKSLPNIILGRMAYVRYDFWYSVSQLGWLTRFLRYGTYKYTTQIAGSLHALQTLSIRKHREFIAAANADSILQETGWLKVYRDSKGFEASRLERKLMDKLSIEYSHVSSDDLHDLEPGLNSVYAAGLLMNQTCSVSDPYALSSSYLELFTSRGGRLQSFNVESIRNRDIKGWVLTSENADLIEAEHLVIACGPWSPDICSKIGYRIPMAWERGYHLNVISPEIRLRRPVCDVERGFVMAPLGPTTRITSGVEFAHRDAKPNFSQILCAVADARTAAALGKPWEDVPWLGSRPTLPDGLPMIGGAGKHDNLWLNFGHQHIGLGTSAGSAVILADQMTGGDNSGMDTQIFSPARFRGI